MDLYILRHGKAEPSCSGIDDDTRALTGKGKKEIWRLAEWLAGKGEKVDLVICSPRKRAVQTAEIIVKGMKIKEEIQISDLLSTGFSTDRLCRKLSSLQNVKSIMVVGHEPDLSLVIGCIISGSHDAAIVMAKGGLARIRNFQPGQRPAGELLWLVNPELIRGCR